MFWLVVRPQRSFAMSVFIPERASSFLFRGERWIIVAVATALAMATNASAQNVSTRHLRDVVATSATQPVGRLPKAQVMSLDIVLSLRDPAGLDTFLDNLYNPANISHRQFLTPAEFTERFGPSQSDYDAVIQYAKSRGLTVTGGTRDGMEVQVKGPVSAIESAFHINLLTYQHPTENRTFYGPDREPTTSLAFPLWHISGLDNYSIPHPMYVKRSDYAKAQGIAPEAVVPHATTGSGPSASFLGSDIRAAYYGGTALTGAGQNLGLLEYYGTDLADLDTYFKNVGQTNNVPITLLSTDGTSTSCEYTAADGDCDDTEQTLDMTQAIGMAPGLSSLVLYIGSTDTAMISAMTTHSPLPTTIGSSWTWTPADPSTLNPYFEKMAAQGQTYFNASGDNSTWSRRENEWPSDNAYVVAVGGTDLITASAGGAWASETAWADSGGGISPNKIAIPSWQQTTGVINSSNKGSTTYRNGPDVSANANFSFYTCADQEACLANEYGGTSFATPMWAGYIALVNELLSENGEAAMGFLNPTIYAQNVTSSYGVDFHDITSGTSGSFSAATGYDLVTGWGSPKADPGVGPAVTKLQFGTIAFGSTEVVPLTITNVWVPGTVTIGTAINGPSYKILTTAQNTCQSGVSAGQSCTLPVEFSAVSIGVKNDVLTVTPSIGGEVSTVVLDGIASGVSAGANSLQFGTIAFGSTEVLTLTITNTGVAGTVMVGTAINGPSYKVLATSQNTCLAGIKAGQSCTLPVEFSPVSTGVKDDVLTLTPSGGAAASTVALLGTASSAQ
jgi:subtilase family serine protease